VITQNPGGSKDQHQKNPVKQEQSLCVTTGNPAFSTDADHWLIKV